MKIGSFYTPPHRKFFLGMGIILFLSSRLGGEETITDPFRLAVRHIESKGVGYNRGYSTLEAFYAATETLGNPWIPFLDLRGHLLNDGRSAINAGVGLRYATKRVWGVNGYYDYRKTFGAHYNQVGFGLESLGEAWDVRLNGYLPFGRQMHSLSSKTEFALKSLNAEAAAAINAFRKAPLYLAAGLYYLKGPGKVALGGQVRGTVEMYQHLRLEANVSYDSLFHWVGQGQLGVFFLIGGKKKGKEKRACSFQRVDRNEVIPVDSFSS